MPQAAERKALEKGLHKLNENMVTLAELAELSIRKAVDGLTRLDPEVAQEVFTLDQEVYGLQLEIERTCIDLLALHAPVARDLRTITTSLKITTDLDRIGRYGKDLSELTLQFLTSPPFGIQPFTLFDNDMTHPYSSSTVNPIPNPFPFTPLKPGAAFNFANTCRAWPSGCTRRRSSGR